MGFDRKRLSVVLVLLGHVAALLSQAIPDTTQNSTGPVPSVAPTASVQSAPAPVPSKDTPGKTAQKSSKPPAGTALQVTPQTTVAGSTTDITLTGSGVSELLPKISDVSKVEVYTSPVSGNAVKISTITVGRPSQQGSANQIRLGLNVSAETPAGAYELYGNGNPTGALFQVTAGSSVQQAPAATTQTPIHVEPPTSPPGQVVNVKLSGGDIANQLKTVTKDKLHLYWQIPPGNHTDFNVMLSVTDVESSATDSSVTIQISIAPDAMSGTYQLYQDSGASGNSAAPTALAVRFVVGASSLGEYIYCPLMPFQGDTTDLLCSQSLLTYKEEREVFGKAVADQYIAIEVKVQNRNSQYQFLLADVRIGTSSSQLTTSRDRTFVRTFAEKGEAFSVRAISLRALDAAGAILGGIGPAVGNAILSASVQIIVGPSTSAMHGLFPDRSAHEIEMINDSGFSVVQPIVIPAKSPIRIFCFVPQREMLDKPLSKISDDHAKWDLAKEFRQKQSELFVEIAGMHVLEVKTGPSLNSLSPDSAQSGVKEPVQITLNGTNFDQVRSVQLGEDSTHRYPLEPMSGNSNSATISVTNLDALVSAKGAGATLPVYLITTSGQQVGTSKQFNITAAATQAPNTPPPQGAPPPSQSATPPPTQSNATPPPTKHAPAKPK